MNAVQAKTNPLFLPILLLLISLQAASAYYDRSMQRWPECAKGVCAYSQGEIITLCPASAFPPTGQNCPGNGGPMTLDCILIHELQHVGAKGKNPDDANKLQQCLGCPYGQPHPRK